MSSKLESDVCCHLQVAPSVNATEVTAGLAESNGSLLLGLWRDSLHVICRLTACTPGTAPGPTLGNEYGSMGKLYLFSSHVWGREGSGDCGRVAIEIKVEYQNQASTERSAVAACSV